MSEYQYYEFQALDKPLTAQQQAAMRKLSSRADVGPGHAIFNYSYGSFRGEPLEILAKYFDALFYIANWGTTQLAFRFPQAAIDMRQLEPYRYGDEHGYTAITVEAQGPYLILNIQMSEEEGFGWIQGEDILAKLVSLREDILRGDLRSLYIGWLALVGYHAGASIKRYEETTSYDVDDDLDDDEEDDGDQDPRKLTEPPVPPGLDTLTPALQMLMKLLSVDPDLVSAAAEASPKLEQQKEEPFEAWVALLPPAEGQQFLVRLAQGDVLAGPELRQRLRELGGVNKPALSAPASTRTFAQLMGRVGHHREQRLKREQQEQQRAHIKHLEGVAQRETELWREVPQQLALRTAAGYERGVALLKDLRDLARQRGQIAEFSYQMTQITRDYEKSTALQRRLREARLID